MPRAPVRVLLAVAYLGVHGGGLDVGRGLGRRTLVLAYLADG
jgi:hypothetical protein